jgi:hypothetical protein
MGQGEFSRREFSFSEIRVESWIGRRCRKRETATRNDTCPIIKLFVREMLAVRFRYFGVLQRILSIEQGSRQGFDRESLWQSRHRAINAP